MESSYDIKPAIEEWLRPVARRLAARGVSAGEVALAALVVSLLGGLLILVAPGASWPLVLLPLFLLARFCLAALDGLLAREHGMGSALADSLKELYDVLSDTLLYMPLALVPQMPSALVVIAVVLGVVAEMAGALATQLGGRRRADGPMGKGERAVAFGGVALLLGLGAGAGPWLQIILIVVIALTALTTVNRVRGGLRDGGR